jgi:hypothetical protein
VYAVRAVRALFVIRDLGAEESARDRMQRITRDAHRSTILDRDEHRARIGTIMRARGLDHARAIV